MYTFKPVTVEDILANINRIAEIEAEVKARQEQIQRLQAEGRDTERLLTELRQVDAVIDGVPLSMREYVAYSKDGIPNIEYRTVGRKDILEAIVYANAHNKGETWGLRLTELKCDGKYYSGMTPAGSGGLFMGSMFTREEAKEQAIRFVTTGKYKYKR